MAMTLSGRVLVAVTRSRGALLPHIANDLQLSRRDHLPTYLSSKAYVAYVECTSHVCSSHPARPSSHLYHLKTLHHTRWAPPHSLTLLTRSLHSSTAWFHDTRPSGEQPPELKSPPPAPVVRKSLYRRVVDELKHYYHGFRLLAIDTRVAGVMVWQLLQGDALTRREKRRLMRTCADLFRLVPFVPFLVVPFMELLLPVFVKLFPGMLPSTFETVSDKERKQAQAAAAKGELALFLRETIQQERLSSRNGNGNGNGHHGAGVEETDTLTLENLERPQLVALCRMLEVLPIGTNNLLRSRLLAELASIRADDEVIVAEGGPTALDASELQAACHHRGMPSVGLTTEQLHQQLQRWLDLHLNENVPSPLLLLSRALYLMELKPKIPVIPPVPKLKNGGHPPLAGSTEASGDAHSSSAAADVLLADPAPNIKDRSQEEAVRDRAPSLADDKYLSPAEVLVAKEATDAAQNSKSNSNGV